MRIHGNGQIRIGDPSGNPQTNFDVVRTSASTLTDIMLVKGDTGNGFIRFQDNDNSCNYTFGADDGSGLGANAFILYDRNNSAYRWSVDNSGNMKVWDGNIQLANGHGIDFSSTSNSAGTMSSELLDDYEEGSFTPVLAMSSGGHNVGYAIQLGKYTKIGNMVHVEVYIELNAISSNGSGYLRLNNLPFTSITGSSNTYGGLHCPWYNSMNNTPMRGGLIDRGNNWAFLYNQFESGTGTIQNASIASAFGVGSKFILVGSYTAQ